MLRFKPKAERVRLIMSDEVPGCMREHAGKVFAVIGPFDEFTDKQALQDALAAFVRGWNLTAEPATEGTTDG